MAKVKKNKTDQLNDIFKEAKKKPVIIHSKKIGKSFILMNEQTFSGIINEISSLKNRVLGMSNIVDKNTVPYKMNDKTRLNRFKSNKKTSKKSAKS